MTPEEFKAIRKRAGLTQEQVARLLQVHSFVTIGRYERGEREISGACAMLMDMLDHGELPERFMALIPGRV